jgi:hypothetical protein
MSLSIHHHIGYYFVCEKRDDIDQESLFPTDDFYRVYDEAGNKDINEQDIYIPNKDCEGCFSLSEDSDTGVLSFDYTSIPDLIVQGGITLKLNYQTVRCCYGVVSWVY